MLVRLVRPLSGFLVFTALGAAPLHAQIPTPRDTAQVDTAGVLLPELTVTVTRTAEPLSRVPAAVGVLGRTELRRGQATLGIDEALNNIPGVYVANRYNFSLDQRLSIRGFGSRANFGTRGVKILLDGIPQTLPDGQSQLTNLELANIGRVEVLRGSSSSLYGNASGGVIAFQTEPPGAEPFGQTIRVEGGSFGLLKVQSRTSGRGRKANGSLSISRTQLDGFRQQSAAELTQVNVAGDYAFSDRTTASLRFGYGDAPEAKNPGALTFAEASANPDSAAGNNILRRADKDVSQQQLAFTVRHETGAGQLSATVFGLLRDLKNPLATPPPSGPGPDVGTFVDIERRVGGARLTGERRLGPVDRPLVVTAGVDVQRMRDDRTNARAIAGVPDTLILNQRETVTEIGPFVQLTWNATPNVLLSAGGRYDAVRFSVDDRHLTDGTDNSGHRTMSAVSGNLGASYTRNERFIPYVNLATSFETPTTTELANQPNSTGGFNTSLDPQRAVTYEVGARGRVGRVEYSVAGFVSRISDAIVQFREVSGRAFFTNAGKLKNDGIEVGLSVAPVRGLRVFGNYTYANYRFGEYRITNGTAVDTLDGNRLPGVPKAFVRLGLRANPVPSVALDLDHTMSSSIVATDDNTIYISGFSSDPGVLKGLGTGVTNARLSWDGTAGRARIVPFVGVNNLWDRNYISSLTLNGAFGRVFEPAPGRHYYVGLELGYRSR